MWEAMSSNLPIQSVQNLGTHSSCSMTLPSELKLQNALLQIYYATARVKTHTHTHVTSGS